MGTGQGKSGGGVVEAGAGPRGRVVALLASLRETRLHVIRSSGSLEIFQVAADAGGIRASQIVIPVYVALGALHRRMSAGQREAGCRVIKRGIHPRSCVVALSTVVRESGLHVVRLCRVREILLVTREAVRRRAHELVVDVALRAGHSRVRADQRILGERVVIEVGRRVPRAGVVAILAGVGEAGLCVRRVVGLIKVRQVAANAISLYGVELATRVAGAAVQGCVRPGQGKTRDGMVELRGHPVVHRVALLALRGEFQLDVIDAYGLGVDEISLMAGNALRRKSLELPHGCALMAGVAVHGGVRADQREPVQVLVNLLHRNMPTLDGMTLFAIGAHLALVDVSVAVGA